MTSFFFFEVISSVAVQAVADQPITWRYAAPPSTETHNTPCHADFVGRTCTVLTFSFRLRLSLSIFKNLESEVKANLEKQQILL